MHSKLIAGGLAMVSLSVFAQSNVTIYGIVDTSVEHLTNVSAAGNSVTRVPTLTGLMPSRIGFRGNEDLGGGLSAFFHLEMGLAADSGTLNNGGRQFGRGANVGLAGPWGRLTLGRQATMTLQATGSHVMGPALYAISSQDPYLANAFSDNAIGYLGTFNGWTVGATYSLGRDTMAGATPAATNCPGELATDRKACTQWSAAIRYDQTSWGVAASRDTFRGGPGAAFTMTSSAYTDTRTIASVWAKFGAVKVSGGVVHRDRQSSVERKSNLYYAGTSYALTPTTSIEGEISRTDVKNSGDDVNMVVLRVVHHLSKRTAIYAMTGRVDNHGVAATSLSAGGTVGAGKAQSGLAMGIHHKF